MTDTTTPTDTPPAQAWTPSAGAIATGALVQLLTDTMERVQAQPAAATPPGSSPTIGALAGALARAQGQMEHALKDHTAQVRSDKGNYSYGYATLAGVIDACRPALTSNGLAVVQRTRREPDAAVVTTIITHESGEWMTCGDLSVPVKKKDDAQALGSALTYARRYAYAAAIGVAVAEDDDGVAASQQPTRGASKRTTAPKRPVAKKADRDALLSRIKQLPDDAREVIGNRLREGGVVWDELTKAQLADVTGWVDAATVVHEPPAEPMPPVEQSVPCPACAGSGESADVEDDGTCPECHGSGEV